MTTAATTAATTVTESPQVETQIPVADIAQPVPSSPIMLYLAIPLILLIALLFLFSHHEAISQPPLVPAVSPVYPPIVAQAPVNASVAPKTPVQSSLSTAPAASASARGGLSTDPGFFNPAPTGNPNCVPGSQYFPACTFLSPRSTDYSGNPFCFKGAQSWPLCLVTSVKTSSVWR